MSDQANVLPVIRELANCHLDPAEAYSRLRTSGIGGFLLESAAQHTGSGDFSFLGVAPFETLEIRRGVLTARRPDGHSRVVASREPLLALDRELSKFRCARAEVPFSGGAVGYLGYDCVRYLEDVPVPQAAGDAPDALFMVFGTVVAFDHREGRILLIGNVFLEDESEQAGRLRVERELDQLERRLNQAINLIEVFSVGELQASMGAERFHAAVRTVRRHIRDGDLLQCVVAEQMSAPAQGDAFAVYRALRHSSRAPYLFHLDLDDRPHHQLLGASPEMLVRVEDRRLETRPIAGTRPRGLTRHDDMKYERSLRRSVKERAEHLMLVDLARNDAGRVAEPGSVEVPEFMSVHRFSHVMHLVSRVTARVRAEVTPMQSLYSCFPAGTLTGAPKIRAMEILAGLEAAGRGPYGGAVVSLAFDGRLDSCIVIRSLHVRGGVARVAAGAGIVADSLPEREYAEVARKMSAVREAMATAAPSPAVDAGAVA